jgi:hypothetical protein
LKLAQSELKGKSLKSVGIALDIRDSAVIQGGVRAFDREDKERNNNTTRLRHLPIPGGDMLRFFSSSAPGRTRMKVNLSSAHLRVKDAASARVTLRRVGFDPATFTCQSRSPSLSLMLTVTAIAHRDCRARAALSLRLALNLNPSRSNLNYIDRKCCVQGEVETWRFLIVLECCTVKR